MQVDKHGKLRRITWMESTVMTIAVASLVYIWLNGGRVFDTLHVVFFAWNVAIEVMRVFGHMQANLFITLRFVAGCFLAPRFFIEGEDDPFKHRCFGSYAIVYRILIPYYFRHKPVFVVASSISLLINESHCTRMSFQASGTEMPPRVYVVLSLLTLVSWLFGKILWTEWRTLCQTQRALAEEKAAQEGLISMLCDFCVHIDVDGDTVSQGSRHLEIMLGQKIEVRKLSDYLLDHSGERTRVCAAFQRARMSPVNIPVSLLSRWAENRLDMFIVRRSTELVESGQEKDLGFLVGFRFTRDGMDTSSSMETSGTIAMCSAGAPSDFDSVSVSTRNQHFFAQQQSKIEAPPSAFDSVSISTRNQHHLVQQQPKIEAAPSEWDLRTSSSLFYCGHDQDLPIANVDASQLAPLESQSIPMLAPSDTHRSGADSCDVLIEQPEHHEPVSTPCDENKQTCRAMTRSSNDRAFESGMIVREEHTYHARKQHQLVDCRSVLSAPPRVSFETYTDSPTGLAPVSCVPKAEEGASDWGFAAIEALDCEASSSASQSSNGTELIVRVGNESEFPTLPSGFCLSTLLRLKEAGMASIGTARAPDECIPCNFYHSAKGCRASFMCLYCHDPSHFRKTSRSTRKMRASRFGKSASEITK